MRKFMFVALLAVACSGEVRAQDAAAGEKVFGVCKTCHQIGETGKNGVGPVLNGIDRSSGRQRARLFLFSRKQKLRHHLG